MDAQYHFIKMSRSSTWAEEETGERMPKKRLSLARRMIPYIIIIILSLALIVAVIVTGLRFNESVKKTENKHSLDLVNGDLDPPPNMPDPAPNSLAVGVIISMNNFDPGSSILSFDMEAFLAKLNDDNGPMDADAIPVCFFVADPDGLSSPLILSINYGNKRNINSTSYNTTADGSISHFPFDTYSGSLVIGAQSLTNATDNSVVPCPEIFDYDRSEASDITVTVLPLYFEIGQDLDSFSAHTSLQQLSENDTLAFFGDGTVLLSATIHRREVVRFFAVLMFITTWLVTLGVVIATTVVLLKNRQTERFDIVAASTALLFALPSLRSATPGIPDTPTVSDAVGYFWQIALLALSTFVLLCHAIWKMMIGKAEEEGANKKIA
ncbi:hypothetical protein GGX14DRAFT_458571 [Mycena pura]|uniref:DUF4436 domain-containing protein n=1 Tax=Mycena pura TaxID=153505 RepID=A0AAD6VAH1_9AGAR|nr:hypothetical protein GGX14DRAFT_458571 [Mycena pura]